MRRLRARILLVVCLIALWGLIASLSHQNTERYLSERQSKNGLRWAVAACITWPSGQHLENLALNLWGRGDKEKAGRILLRLHRSGHPLTKWGYYELVKYVGWEQHQPAGAVQIAREATLTFPSSPLMLFALGRAHLKNNEPQDAVTAFNEAWAATKRVETAKRLRSATGWFRCSALMAARDFAGASAAAAEAAKEFPDALQFAQAQATAAEGEGDFRRAAHYWLTVACTPNRRQGRALYDVCRLYGRTGQLREGLKLLEQRDKELTSAWEHVCRAALLAEVLPKQAQRELEQADPSGLSKSAIEQVKLLTAVAPLWTKPVRNPAIARPEASSDETALTWYWQVYGLQAQRDAGDRNARAWLGQYEVEFASKGNAAFYLDLRDIMDGRQLRMPRLLGAVRFESAIDEADASDTMEAA